MGMDGERSDAFILIVLIANIHGKSKLPPHSARYFTPMGRYHYHIQYQQQSSITVTIISVFQVMLGKV